MRKGLMIGGIVFGVVAILMLLAVATPLMSDMSEDMKRTAHKNTGEVYQLVEARGLIEIELSSLSDTATINDRIYTLDASGINYVVGDSMMICRSGMQHIIWTTSGDVILSIDPTATETTASIVIEDGGWRVTSGDADLTGAYEWLYYLGGAAGNFIQVSDVRDHFLDSDSLIIFNNIGGEIDLVTAPAKAGDRKAATHVYGDPTLPETTTTWIFDPAETGEGQVEGVVFEIVGDDGGYAALIPLKYYTHEENTTSMMIDLMPLLLAVIVLVFMVTMLMKTTKTRNEI